MSTGYAVELSAGTNTAVVNVRGEESVAEVLQAWGGVQDVAAGEVAMRHAEEVEVGPEGALMNVCSAALWNRDRIEARLSPDGNSVMLVRVTNRWRPVDPSERLSNLALLPYKRVSPPELRFTPHSETNSFHLRLRTLTGKRMRVGVEGGVTVLQVKHYIERREGIPSDQQRLLYGSVALEDDRTLSACGVTAADELLVCLRLRGGMYHASSGRDDLLRCMQSPLTIHTPLGPVSTAHLSPSADSFLDALRHHLLGAASAPLT
eukprot:TRINITY_DN1740_c0_g3_i2.p2 TRINITY_DN1740_c0_g3~~TRINITY_DN1740_c0_g3_i2.p2  ORF type:complete len:263 (-),score=80.89 TRINITY_DN1740_c0_g3_i2:193-981(-)